MDNNEGHEFKSTNIESSKSHERMDYFEKNNKKKSPHFWSRKIRIFGKQIPVLIPVIFAVIILAIGVFAAIYFIGSRVTEVTPIPEEANSSEELDADETAENTEEYISDEFEEQVSATLNNGLDSFLIEYQKQIDSTEDASVRASIYLQRANNLFSYSLEQDEPDQTYLDQALQDALTAEQLAPSEVTANTISNIYYYLGDDANGEKYEQLSNERDSANEEG